MAQFDSQIAHLFASRFSCSASAIALTGSQAKGFATIRSDIDLIVLINDGSDQLKNDTFTTEIIDGHRAEILYLEPSYIKMKLASYIDNSYEGITYDERKFIEKLRGAIPIVGKRHWDDAISNFSLDLYEESVLKKSLAMSSKIFDDAVGHYIEGDHFLAVESVRSLLQHEMESLLCFAGDTSERRRWLLRRLQQNPQIDDRIANGFADFCYNMINREYASLKNWLDAAMRFHQLVQLLINLQMMDQPVGDFIEYTRRESQSFVSTDWLFIRLAQKTWFAKTLYRNVIIDEPTAMILSLCRVPRSEEEIAMLLSKYRDNRGESFDANGVKQMLIRLHDAGLLTRE